MWTYVPQRCFVKGYQKDFAHCVTVVGVSVTRQELRLLEPYLDIMGYGVDCDRVGGLSGRFHDL